MPWATLKNIFFFCCQESDEIQDESSHHLIPSQSVEAPVIHSNVVLPDHRQLQERMGLIVRTKEGKMVNVASQVPFNLHNKVLPPERFYGSVSHSSLDQRARDHDYQTDYSNHGNARPRNFYISSCNDGQTDKSRSASPSSDLMAEPSPYTRCLPRTLDHPTPTPILNVRLVGYTDNMTKSRGRTRDRPSLSTDLPNASQEITREGDEVATTPGNTETSCDGLIAASTFKLRDVGSITLNWND